MCCHESTHAIVVIILSSLSRMAAEPHKIVSEFSVHTRLHESCSDIGAGFTETDLGAEGSTSTSFNVYV